MKKIAALILALVLALACIACVDNNQEGSESKTRPVVPTKESEPLESEPVESSDPESEESTTTPVETEPETEPATETKKNTTIELPRDEF